MYRYIPLLDIITESILTEKLKPYKLATKENMFKDSMAVTWV